VFTHSPVYFVTFCTYRRRPFLATPRVHRAFVEFADHAYSSHGIAVGRYVIMPDHVHLFVAGDRALTLGRWVGVLKQALAKALVRPATTEPVWQRGFFDHLLRSDESYSQKWEYVRANPVRAGLVAECEDWPYAGEVISVRHN
jgi:REP element-mobilizing transposase RayT